MFKHEPHSVLDWSRKLYKELINTIGKEPVIYFYACLITALNGSREAVLMVRADFIFSTKRVKAWGKKCKELNQACMISVHENDDRVVSTYTHFNVPKEYFDLNTRIGRNIEKHQVYGVLAEEGVHKILVIGDE